MTAQEQARESVTVLTKTNAAVRAGRHSLHPKRWRTGPLTLDDLSIGHSRVTPLCDNIICGQRCAAALITNAGIKQCCNTCIAFADTPHATPTMITPELWATMTMMTRMADPFSESFTCHLAWGGLIFLTRYHLLRGRVQKFKRATCQLVIIATFHCDCMI